jgi:hypothetical protein
VCGIVDQLIILILGPIFYAISFFYSSVGFAGGSSYIAILVLAGVNLYAVPSIFLTTDFYKQIKSSHSIPKAGSVSYTSHGYVDL